MNRNRRIALFVLLALLVTPMLFVLAGPDEGTMSSSINSAREANGLNALISHSTLVTYARQHSAEMLGTNSIYHSSSGELTGLVSGWQRIGENVGRGPSASSIFNAFMNSPGHRDNILGDYTHIGVGHELAADGILYVTTIFMKLPAAPPTTTTTTTSTPAPTSTSGSTSTSTSTSTTTSTSTSTTTPTGSTVPALSVGEAVGCAQSALGTGSADMSGSAEVTVTNCAEAAEASARWPAGTVVDAVESADGAIVLSFRFTPPTTTSTSTTPSASTSTSTIAPTTSTSPGFDFTQPAAPGAADLVRVVAGITLAGLVLILIFVLFRRRR